MIALLAMTFEAEVSQVLTKQNYNLQRIVMSAGGER
ncbi:hypothetical protein BN1088_540014 [Sphingobacterium sp. PM2-P1-29]|nr:hypothetical protein BN1088_540014 [Sphingobacterium sp. PM2-P1-29]